MAKAKITCREGYKCAPQGHTVILFPFGKIVEGQVADWACKDGSAKRLFEKKLKPKLEDKNLVPNLKDKASK